jgi:hypothetical protein
MATAKGGTKKYAKKPGGSKNCIVPLYAAPIRDSVASGNLREMKSMAAKAHKHIAAVQASLAKLEAAIAKHSA